VLSLDVCNSDNKAVMRMRRLAPAVLLLVLFVPCASAWTWPVRGPVLQTFSFDQAHPYAAGQQRGIAIGADAGAPVLAPAAGSVSFAGTVAANGKTVTIQTAAGLAVSLTHLGSIVVQQNDSVAEGAPLGTVGPSGTAEFGVPYVHLGIRDAGNPQGYLDPLSFLPVAATPVAAPTPAPPPVEVRAPAPPAETPAPVAQPAAAPAIPRIEAPAPAAATPAPVVEAPTAPPAAATPPAAAPVRSVEAPAASEAPAGSAPGLTLVPRPAAEPTIVVAQPVAPRAQRGPLRPLVPVLPAVALRAGTASPPAVRVRPLPETHGVPAAPAPRSVAPPPAGSPGRVRLAPHAHRAFPLVAALLALAAAAVGVTAIRMIRGPSSDTEGASSGREDPRRAGMAVREWAAPHRPRGGLRRAGRRLRALPPPQGQRRPHGERHGRARNARDGLRRPQQRLAA
jgi:Peptidase family M23